MEISALHSRLHQTVDAMVQLRLDVFEFEWRVRVYSSLAKMIDGQEVQWYNDDDIMGRRRGTRAAAGLTDEVTSWTPPHNIQ